MECELSIQTKGMCEYLSFFFNSHCRSMKGNYYLRNFHFPPKCVRKIMSIKPLEIQGTYKNIDSCRWNMIVSLNRCEQNPNTLWRANNEQTIVLLRAQHSAATQFHTVRKKKTLGPLDQSWTFFGQFLVHNVQGVKKKKDRWRPTCGF